MSAALNLKIDKRSSSASAGSYRLELMTGDESGVPVTQMSHEFRSMCGSDAAGSVASVAGLSFPSLDGAVWSGS